MKNQRVHIPVLLQEVIEMLSPKAGEVLLDGTLGEAGHSIGICDSLGGNLHVIGLDLDQNTLEVARERIKGHALKADLFQENFRNLKEVVSKIGLEKIDMMLLDLGMSSRSLEVSGRGFSFKKDEPLLMTYSEDATLTAKDLLNLWSEEQIEVVLKNYGNERFASRIAKAIVFRRKEAEFERTIDLVEVIEKAVPAWKRTQKIHPATKTFQALRVAVNDELEALEEAMTDGFSMMRKGGRMAIITFHSLEDRIVKRQMKEWHKDNEAELINKKPITPGKEEIKLNPRARSAKLRGIKKI